MCKKKFWGFEVACSRCALYSGWNARGDNPEKDPFSGFHSSEDLRKLWSLDNFRWKYPFKTFMKSPLEEDRCDYECCNFSVEAWENECVKAWKRDVQRMGSEIEARKIHVKPPMLHCREAEEAKDIYHPLATNFSWAKTGPCPFAILYDDFASSVPDEEKWKRELEANRAVIEAQQQGFLVPDGPQLELISLSECVPPGYYEELIRKRTMEES